MSSSPAIDIPAEALDRWQELQRLRARRRATPCDCQCRRCVSGPGRSARPEAGRGR